MMKGPLANHADVTYHDLGSTTRQPPLLAARLRATAASIGTDTPWHKTAPWSAAIQRYCLGAGWISELRPTLFFQTLAAPVLGPEYRYSIYTDRVAREGALESGPFRSTWGPGWIEREHEFLSRADSIFVMGPSSRDSLGDLYGIDKKKVLVVGAGPGTEIGPISAEIRRPTRLLFVGTSWSLKGGNEVIQAFAKLAEGHPDLELTLVGSEPNRTPPDGVRSLGRVPRQRMPGLFAESDVFVVPTYMEALGYSLLEALMHGVPCIGSTVGNQAWLIGEAGRVVAPGAVDELVEAIEEIISDFDAYKAKAVKRAGELRRTMSWESVASAITTSMMTQRDGR